MGCADCGCVIESGVRIVICSDDCCCRDVPASEQATLVRQPSDRGIERDGIRAELEQARATFHALVQSAGEEELGQQSNGTRWTNRQLLFHMMFGYMLVRSLLILVKCFSRLPLSCSRVSARFLDVLAGPFNLVNYWGPVPGPACTAMSAWTRSLMRSSGAALRDSIPVHVMHNPPPADV